MSRPVYAHICTWFRTREISGEWQMWNSEYEQAPHDPNRFQWDGRRDIAAVDYPLIDLYDSTDPAAIEYQLLLMRLAGIDGVIVDWDGTRLNAYRHEALMELVPHLQTYGLKLMICYEEACGYLPIGVFASRQEEREAALHDARWLVRHLLDQPFYGKLDGRKPVLVFRKCPEKWFSPAEWPPLRQAFTDAGGSVLFPPDSDDAFDAIADGRYFWVGGFDSDTRFSSLAHIRLRYGDFLAGQRERDGVTFGSVVSGFNDSPVWGWGDLPRSAPRYDGERYRLMWEMSLEAEVDAVQIVTWNDWNEGSHIEPSSDFGYSYLELTKTWSARFKGQETTVPDEALRLPHQLYLERQRVRQFGESELAAATQRLDQARVAILDGHYGDARHLLTSETS